MRLAVIDLADQRFQSHSLSLSHSFTLSLSPSLAVSPTHWLSGARQRADQFR